MKKLLLILILLAFPASAVAEYKPPPKQPGPYVGDTIKGAEFTWLGEPYCEIGFPGLPGCKGTISSHWLRCPAGSCEPIQEGSLSYKVVQADLGSEMWFYTASKGTETDGSTFSFVQFNSKYEAVKTHGTILWQGDGAEALWKEWTAVFQGPVEWNVAGTMCSVNSTAANTSNERLKLETTGPAATSARGKAIKYFSKTSDVCFEHPRSELGSDKGPRGIYSTGEEVWVAFEFYLPEKSGEKPGYTFGSGLAQWQDVNAKCNPPIGWGTSTNELWLKIWDTGCSTGNVNKKVATVAKNKWYKLVTYIKFSTSNTVGEVKAYFAEQGKALPTEPQVVEKHKTIHVAGDPENGSATPAGKDTTRTGLYPEVGNELYIAGYTVGTTREIVENNAFNP